MSSPAPGRRRRRLGAIAAGAVAVLALLAGYVVQSSSTVIDGEASPSMSPDEVEIRQRVQDFAVAVANVDDNRIVELLCPEEADQYLDAIGEPADDEPADPVDHVDLDVLRVTIEDPYAAAVVSDDKGERSVYLLRVDGAWTMCQSARDQMTSAAPTTD